MTNEERESLNFHGGNISYAGLEGLVEYVEGLLEAEYQYGYDTGWDESERHSERR